MSKWQTRIAWGLVLAIGAGLCLFWPAGPGAAQQRERNEAAPETLLPADPVLYVGWDGNAGHAQAWERTAAYEALYETGLIDAITKMASGLLAQAQGNADAAKQMALLKSVYETVSANGVSLAVTVTPAAGPPQVQGTVVLHRASGLERDLAAFVKEAAPNVRFETKTVQRRRVTFAPIPDTPGYEVAWWSEGGHLVIAVGQSPAETAIKVATGSAPNVTTSRLWKKYAESKRDFERSSLAWLDFETLRGMFGGMPLPQAQPGGRALTVNDVLEAAGLDNLSALVMQSGYRGRALWSETTVDTEGPLRGLLAFADREPITLDDLPPLPERTQSFYAASVDWTRFYENAVALARDVAALGPPETSAQLEGMIENLPAMLPFDPKTDLLDALGNVAAVYSDSDQSFFGLGFGVAIKVKDAAKVRDTLQKIVSIAAEQTTPEQLNIRTTQKHGREIVTLAIGGEFFNPSYAVDDEWLVVGILPQAVDAFLLRVDGKLPKWEPSREFQEGFKELPQEFTSITVTDPRETIRGLMSFAPLLVPAFQQGMRQAGIGGGEALPVALAELPPAELVARPLFPNITVTTVGENGITITARTSLPAIPLLGAGGSTSVATTGILVALLLPAVQSAREAARRTQSRNNLKQIGLALHNYHDVHGNFPRGTHPNEDLKPEKRLSWMADILPFLEQAPLFNEINFDEAWDSEDNEELMKIMLAVYQNPAVSAPGDSEFATTHYVGIAGLGKDAAKLPVTSEKAGVFGYDRVVRIRDITDGTSNTVAVSEAHKDFGPWGAGGNPTIRGLTQQPYINGPDGIGSPFRGGANMLFCDGAVRFVSENIDPTVMEALTTIRGGEVVGDIP